MMRYTPTEEFRDERREMTLQKLRLPEQDGVGVSYQYWGRDFNFIALNCSFKEQKQYTVHHSDWIAFSYTLRSMINVQYTHKNNSMFHPDMNWCVLRERPGTSKLHTISANDNLKWVTFCCSSSYLERILGREIDKYYDLEGMWSVQ